MRVLPLGAVLNECQRSLSVHGKYAASLAQRRRDEPEALVRELMTLMRHVMLVSKREPAVERLVKFVATLASREDGEAGNEDDAFVEELLWTLVPLSQAADKAVRFRACQLVAAVLNGLSEHAELSDALYERLTTAMADRLRDKAPAARAEAARALARLQDQGEAGDYAECAVTAALLSLLECDKSKDVRKAVVSSVAVSHATLPALVERTRDLSQDVRRTAFLMLANKVPLGDLSIASRATVLRRGLADRETPVRAAAVVMLGKWMDACKGDVVRLLAALDVETHEAVAETLLTELISCSAIKPTEVALSQSGTGLRRSLADDGLLSPELALYWRVICEALTSDAAALGSGAATGGGQAAAVAAASASEKLEALEAALPDTMGEFCALARAHTAGGAPARFASRQLLRLACRLDLSDVTAARAASALAEELLCCAPAPGSYGGGGRGDWERTLVAFAQAALGPHAAGAVYSAAATVRAREPEAEACWVQALGVVAPLLQTAPSARAAGGAAALRDLQRDLVLPAVQHASAAVRREGMRCLGLLCCLEAAPDAALVALLRSAAACDARPVRTQAVRALCDLALLHGPERLNQALPPTPQEAPADDAASAPLLPSLLRWLGEAAQGLAPGGGAAEEEEEVRTVAAEGLAKLLLLDCAGELAGQGALPCEALAQLMLLHQSADEHAHPRLAQCLTVFFPVFAAASAQHKLRLAAAALPALRSAVGRRWLPKLAAFLGQQLGEPLAQGAGGNDAGADLGMEALARELLREALLAHSHFAKGAQLKPFLAALVRTATSLQLRAPDAMPAHQAQAQVAAIQSLRACAQLLRDRLADKPLAKELNAWLARLLKLAGVAAEEEPSEELAMAVLERGDEWRESVAHALPLKASGGAGAAATRAPRAAKVAAAETIAMVATRTRGGGKAPAPQAAALSDSDESEEDDDDASADNFNDSEASDASDAEDADLDVQPSKPVARAALAENIALNV